MKKRRLGRTNLNVSVVGFGGEWVIPSSVEYALKMYERALELGVTYFDAARVYGNVEEKLGIALEDVREFICILFFILFSFPSSYAASCCGKIEMRQILLF